MKSFKCAITFMTVGLVAVLFGCGIAHVKTDVQTQDLKNYDNIMIRNVKVYSLELAAEDNIPLQEKLKNWEEFSRNQLEESVNNSQYKLVESCYNAIGKTLTMDLDVNVQYGNRALRYWVGFGAGEGGVDSVLTIKDAKTGDVKFQAQANSDLNFGAAGGDIGGVLRGNIQRLIEQYKISAQIKQDTTE